MRTESQKHTRPPTHTSRTLPNFHHAARRRESISIVSKVKLQAAPPSASFTNAETRPTSRGRPHMAANQQKLEAATLVQDREK
jgi:hypothetical protein